MKDFRIEIVVLIYPGAQRYLVYMKNHGRSAQLSPPPDSDPNIEAREVYRITGHCKLRVHNFCPTVSVQYDNDEAAKYLGWIK